MTTISVVVATYGDPHWLQLGNDVALPSTYLQDEHQLVPKYEREGSRASSLNNAAAEATGDWLIFLDADDELAPGYVGAMRQAIEQSHHRELALFTPAVQYVRKGRSAPAKFNDRGISLRDDNWLVIGTVIHRDLFHSVGGFDDYPHGFEDWALWSKCWRLGAQVVKVKDAVYRAHINPGSAHRQRWRDRKWQVATHLRIKAELDAWEAAQ